MLSISLIIFFSVVLFAYWFRYSCLLILQNRTGSSSAFDLAAAGASFVEIKERLKGETNGIEVPEQMWQAVRQDYQKLCFLLSSSAGGTLDPIEQRMLKLDYRIMQLLYMV